jgi:hypothetical protein
MRKERKLEKKFKSQRKSNLQIFEQPPASTSRTHLRKRIDPRSISVQRRWMIWLGRVREFQRKHVKIPLAMTDGSKQQTGPSSQPNKNFYDEVDFE